MAVILKIYECKDIEKKWQKKWLKDQIYKWDSSKNRLETYVIDTPPPTVSGNLHMGHVYSYTQLDLIARFKRMKGQTVYFPIGFDDNGLPTERLVEKDKKILAKNLNRQEFQEICRDHVVEYEKAFENLFNSIGLSIDWNEKYQTISPNSIALSQMSFLDLLHKEHIKREFAPSFWDSVDKTAIAQAELEDKERKGQMYDITFDLAEKEGTITISTTRPELLSACQAILFNEEDVRYLHLKGQKAKTPIFDQTVPFVADKDVDIAKGSGLVMVCTFGGFQDVEWQRRYNLEIKQCIDLEGKMINSKFLDGLKVEEARKTIVEKLDELKRITGVTEVTQVVKCAERSGKEVEIIPTLQWYISVLPYKKELSEQVNKCKWHPDFMRHRALLWIEGLRQDWCISRQRYFGVPFPVWYSKRAGEEGKILLAEMDQLPVDPLKHLPKGYKRDEVEAELDVMDTWATSSITPSLGSCWLNEKYYTDCVKYKSLVPADLRPQSHEIIRTWAFGTIVKYYFHRKQIPWTDLMISGWCLAKDHSKMSKSKGNVVDPEKILNQYGADVVRYWAANSKLGVDTAFSEEVLRIGQKLINKLWNAARFFESHLSQHNIAFDNLEEVIKKRIIKEKSFDIIDNHHSLNSISSLIQKFEKSNIDVNFVTTLSALLEEIKHRLF